MVEISSINAEQGAQYRNPEIPVTVTAVAADTAGATDTQDNWVMAAFGANGIVTSIAASIGGVISAVVAVITLWKQRPASPAALTAGHAATSPVTPAPEPQAVAKERPIRRRRPPTRP